MFGTVCVRRQRNWMQQEATARLLGAVFCPNLTNSDTLPWQHPTSALWWLQAAPSVTSSLPPCVFTFILCCSFHLENPFCFDDCTTPRGVKELWPSPRIYTHSQGRKTVCPSAASSSSFSSPHVQAQTELSPCLINSSPQSVWLKQHTEWVLAKPGTPKGYQGWAELPRSCWPLWKGSVIATGTRPESRAGGARHLPCSLRWDLLSQEVGSAPTELLLRLNDLFLLSFIIYYDDQRTRSLWS